MKLTTRAIIMALLLFVGTAPIFSQTVYNSVSELTIGDESNDVTINSEFTIVGYSAYALLFDGNNYAYISPVNKLTSLGLVPGNTIKSLTGYCRKLNPPEFDISNTQDFYGTISKEISKLPEPLVLTNQKLSKGMGYVEVHGTVKEDLNSDENLMVNKYVVKLADESEPAEYLGKEVTITGYVWVNYGETYISIIDIWEGEKEIDISVSASPENGGNVWIDSNKASKTSSITPGSSHSLYAEPNDGWHFVEWAVGAEAIGSENPLSISPETQTHYVAKFEKNPEIYSLSIGTSPVTGGTASISGVNGLTASFDEGTPVTVNAVPAQGYNFVGWKSDNSLVSATTNYSFEIKQNTSLIAEFSAIHAPTRSIKFSSSDITKGIVTADGYSDVNVIETNNPVTLRATPVNDYHSFAYWTKNGVKTNDGAILTYSDESYAEFIAYFTSAYPVTFNNPENGTLAVSYINGNPINSGDKIIEKDKIIIKSVPNQGFRLGSLIINNEKQSIESEVLEFTVSSPVIISVTFEATIPERTVYFRSADEKKGTVISEEYPNVKQIYTSKAVTLKAVPTNENHEFDYWTLNGVRINDSDILIYSDSEEADIIAYFKSSYPVTFTSPANGTVSVKDSDNKDIVSGQKIAENNTVKIQLTPANGYRVTSVLVNNVEISHSSDPINYKVTEPITISGKVEAAAAGTKLITVISSDNSMGKAYINTPGVTSMSISYNGSAELHAEPAMGCKFEGWRQVGTNNFISTDPVYTFYYAASDIHMEAVFNYIIQTPREVTVVSSNSGKGTVKIKDESTTSVTSQRYLTLIATPNTENDFFVDWTNESGKVLSTKNEYIYDNEAPAIITANFKSKYTLDYSVEGETANTVMAIVDDGSELTSGGIIHYSSLVDEGTRIELTIEPVDHYEVSELYVNNKDVATEYYANDCKYTFAINNNIRIKAIIEPQHHSISITEHPHGSISVYKELDVNGNGLGSKLLHGDRTKYGTTLYIFSTPLESYEFESVIINGEKKSAKDGKAYIEHLVDSDVEIIPNFSITTGIDTIHLDNVEDEIIMVFDLSGKYIGKTLPKAHGIYIVKTMTKTLKVKI